MFESQKAAWEAGLSWCKQNSATGGRVEDET